MPPVIGRPFPLVFAAVLLVIIGLSGISAGITIVQAMANTPPTPLIGIEIGAGIAGYGLVATIAGVGLFARRRTFWWLAVGTMAAGLAFLIGLVVIANLDPVATSGLVIWGITLACLLAPATRAALPR
ncbi:MAG TPA: hypothetical protein VE817_01570 [Candidatus Acidoferrum sp.]|nr:hypothetical protein [Candidatus Acidoferrum sp.]